MSQFSKKTMKTNDIKLDNIESLFQRRMVRNDLEKMLPEKLLLKNYDYLLVDLIDERFRIYEIDIDSYITISSEFQKTGFKCNSGHVIVNRDERRRHLFCEAFDRFIDFLDKNKILERTVINQVEYAKYTEDGQEIIGYSDKEINFANQNLMDMYGYIGDRIRKISYPRNAFIANHQHRWGVAPFHYTDCLYKTTLLKLFELM